MSDFIVNIIHRPEMVPEYSATVTGHGKEENIGDKNVLTESLNIFKTQQRIAYENGLKVTIQMTYASLFNDEAVRIARLGRAAGLGDFIKLEIHPDPNYLLPDPIETLKATETLVKEGFKVMAYMNADGALAARLQDAGAAALMPLGAPIGSNMGIRNAEQIAIIIENARLPVVIDAGLGLPSHAAQAMEMGADAVMVNTAIATSADPARMAHAFKLAVEAGRAAYVAGGRWRGSWESLAASPTSPLTAFLEE